MKRVWIQIGLFNDVYCCHTSTCNKHEWQGETTEQQTNTKRSRIKIKRINHRPSSVNGKPESSDHVRSNSKALVCPCGQCSPMQSSKVETKLLPSSWCFFSRESLLSGWQSLKNCYCLQNERVSRLNAAVCRERSNIWNEKTWKDMKRLDLPCLALNFNLEMWLSLLGPHSENFGNTCIPKLLESPR